MIVVQANVNTAQAGTQIPGLSWNVFWAHGQGGPGGPGEAGKGH